MDFIPQLKAKNWNKYAKINKLGVFRNIEKMQPKNSESKDAFIKNKYLVTFQKGNEYTYMLFNNLGLISSGKSYHDLNDFDNSYNVVINNNPSDKKYSLEFVKMLTQTFNTNYSSVATIHNNDLRHIAQEKFNTVMKKASQYIRILTTINNQPIEKQDPYTFSNYKTKLSKLLKSEKNLNNYIEYLNNVLKIVSPQLNPTNVDEK